MSHPAETSAFPKTLIFSVRASISMLSEGQMSPPSPGFKVIVQGESVSIPYRVHYVEDRIWQSAERQGDRAIIALCLGTRHHNGFVRQKCMQRLLLTPEPWTVPFVVRLLGEYVLQIVEVFEEFLPSLDEDLYGAFVSENLAYFDTLERRAVSYWNAYYRHLHPKWKEFPASKVFRHLRGLAGDHASTNRTHGYVIEV